MCKVFLVMLLVSKMAITAPLDSKLIIVGGWPLCPLYPSTCVVVGKETYALAVKPSGTEVMAFQFKVQYVSVGETKEVTGHFMRKPPMYSTSNVLTLGRVQSVLSIAVDELVVK